MTHGGLYGKIFIAQWKQKMNRLYKSGRFWMVMMPELEQTNGSYKNIFAHANEEECPQKRGDKEWRTGALLLSQ